MQGVHRQRVAGAWTTLPGGVTSIFLAIWHAGKCWVQGAPKMQTLPQKCPSLGGAWHHPGLRGPPPVTAGTEKPPALPAGAGAGTEGG